METDGSVILNYACNRIECSVELKDNEDTIDLNLDYLLPGDLNLDYLLPGDLNLDWLKFRLSITWSNSLYSFT